jgi:PKD repeat protein
LTVNFTDTSTGTPTAWTWQWGDGTANGTTQNPSHEFGVGVWTVKLIAANAYGVSSYIKTITVIARDTYTAPDPIPSPSAEPQSSIIQTGAATSYILDKVNNKVLMYDSAKTYLGYFGGIGSGDGQFNTPVWLTKEGNNILVADSGNNRIQVFDANGTFISKFGTANFKGVASNGVYRYATDYDNNKVIVFNMLGVKVTEFGSTGSGRGEFKQPYGIAVDNNYIYVVDKQRLQAFTLGYEFVAEAGRAEVNNPTDLWFDAINLYINNSGNNEVLTYSRAFNFPTSVNISKTLTLTNTIMGAS